MSISLLRRLLMKEAVKDTAGSSGIMSINKNIADKVEQQVQRYVNDAMKQGVDLDTLSPEQLKMIVQINKPKPPRVIAADSPEGRQITEQLFGKRGEVVDMAGKKLDTSQGIMGGKSVKDLMESGQVTKGTVTKKSKKVTDREMFKAANKRLTSDVDSIIKDIKSMEPITAMKEASSVIGRKGKYKNLTEEQSKKILQDTEDHIFERDIPEEDFASGGRAGYSIGDRVMPSNDFMNLGLGNMTQGQNTQTAGLLDMFKDTPEEKALEQIQELRDKENQIKGLGEGAIELKQDELKGIEQQIQDLKNQYPDDESIQQAFNPYANIQGQTAFLDPFTVVGGLIKIGKGAKASVLAKEFLKNKAKEKVGRTIFDKVEKKINPPKYPQGPSNIKTGGGGKSLYDSGSNYRSVDSSGNKVTSKSAAGTTTFDSKSGRGRRDYATGGIARANFVGGGMGRRGFLKMLAGLGAGIGAAKSGIFSLGKGASKEVAKEVVQKSTTGSPPPYFFKLAEKIKMMGDDATATTDRTIAKTLKSKDGKSTYVLEEDVATGDTIIKKVNKEGDEMMTDVEIMELKKGEVVTGKDGRPVKVPDEYEEVTEVNARIEGDTFNDPYFVDGIKIDEIMKEVGEQAPSIKKADGGIMRAGYQMGGDVAYNATDPIYGSSAITVTPDTVMDQFGNQVQSELGNNFNKPLIPQVTKQAHTLQEGIMNNANFSFGDPNNPNPNFSPITDIPTAGGMGGLGEIDMPVAGGNNNQMGILPVEPINQLPGFRDDTFTKMPGGPPPTQPNMSDEDIMKGFAEFKKQNPDIMNRPGTMAIVNLTLPGGTPMSFNSGAGAAALRQYLQSIGMEAGPGKEPFEPFKKAVQPGGTLAALASGGIARMLGE